MNWKGYERKRWWCNLRYYTSICLEGLRKTTKKSVRMPDFGPRFESEPPEYKVGVIATQPGYFFVLHKAVPVLIMSSSKNVMGDVKLYAFLTSGTGGDERSASRSGSFNPGKRTPNILWTGGWVGLQTGSGHGSKEKSPCRGKTPVRPKMTITLMTEQTQLTCVYVLC
jgi:hypothetical protein